jgi:hypothetical protein
MRAAGYDLVLLFMGATPAAGLPTGFVTHPSGVLAGIDADDSSCFCRAARQRSRDKPIRAAEYRRRLEQTSSLEKKLNVPRRPGDRSSKWASKRKKSRAGKTHTAHTHPASPGKQRFCSLRSYFTWK